ncbi:MAG: helix-turn-helix transcriptional regulator [Caulobacterales bacterium]|nr:helix-turn-helix transcriptional regulator [Caulobacterales bacterium]MCA0373461.1 helix-turn-helix transcriptional regulator [Pseudomonadota bacterium]
MKLLKKHVQNQCDDNCPISAASNVIDGRWTTLILRELMNGKKRYNELLRALAGISPRMLALRLKMLEENNIVSRKVFDTNPPTTEYELTNLGNEFSIVLNAIAQFGIKLQNYKNEK